MGSGEQDWAASPYGNVREADTAKVEFALVDPPSRIEADNETPLTVRVVLTNNGPASQVDVTDVVSASGPVDCTFTPVQQTVRRTVRIGQRETVDVPFTVLCTEPSWHRLTFGDLLTLDDPDVREVDPSNNTRSFSTTIPVFDRSDLAVDRTGVDCAATTKVDTTFACTGTATVVNAGPYGPTDAVTTLSLTGPGDCVLEAATPTSHSLDALAVGASRTVSTTWSVTCADRSFHSIRFDAQVAVAHLHVEDPAVGNNASTATDTTEVFEDVDLTASLTALLCSEREANRQASVCDATVVISNAGPADAVQTLLDLNVTPGVGCSSSPSQVQYPRTLATGTSQTLLTRFTITCTTNVRHEVKVDAWLRNAPTDPHAVDTSRDRLIWLPNDAKPTSFPSSINLGKEGVLPFAVLATARVNPLTQVDVRSLRYGVTGTENSVIACRSMGEDVDADGRLDLICHADTKLTGITCTTSLLQMTGRLTDGTRFVSQEDIKVLGCRRG